MIQRVDEKRFDGGLIVFLALAALVLLSPHIAIVFVGLYWAAVIAVGVCALWVTVMPTTCMNGGLICSCVAMAILFNTIAIVLGAIIGLVVSWFT